MVHYPQTGSDGNYNQYNLLKLAMMDKYNNAVIVNPK